MSANTFTQLQLLRMAVRQFGEDPRFFAYTCPSCGDVSCAQDFIDIGADPDRAGQECVGRSLSALSRALTSRDNGRSTTRRGCNRAAYGLIPAPWKIEYGDGKYFHVFRLSTDAEAEVADVFARRDAAADTAEPYVLQVRRAFESAGAGEP